MGEPEERDAQAPGVHEEASPFVDRQEAYRRYIQEGLDDVAAGRVNDWEDGEAELIAKFGDFDR